MIDHSPAPHLTTSVPTASARSIPPLAECFTPWVFMDVRDLFGDGSPEGDFTRTACLHEKSPDGHCRQGHPVHPAVCSDTHPRKRTVRIPSSAKGLPRDSIRAILQAGDELVLQFEPGETPSLAALSEAASILRKLRHTGLAAGVSGLSTADKSRLCRLEWAQS